MKAVQPPLPGSFQQQLAGAQAAIRELLALLDAERERCANCQASKP